MTKDTALSGKSDAHVRLELLARTLAADLLNQINVRNTEHSSPAGILGALVWGALISSPEMTPLMIEGKKVFHQTSEEHPHDTNAYILSLIHTVLLPDAPPLTKEAIIKALVREGERLTNPRRR